MVLPTNVKRNIAGFAEWNSMDYYIEKGKAIGPESLLWGQMAMIRGFLLGTPVTTEKQD